MDELVDDQEDQLEDVIDLRLLHYLIPAILLPGLVSAFLFVAHDLWQVGVRQFASYGVIYEDEPPIPDARTFLNAWFNIQLEHTVINLVMIAMFGLPVFFAARSFCLRNAQKCDYLALVTGAPVVLSLYLLAQTSNWGPHRFELFKCLLSFVIVIICSNAWIAWQAWRSLHPNVRFWPRFSLGALMIVVIAWGALLAVFAPKH